MIFPNPKTSGNARYTYLAAVAFANEKFGGDQAKVEAFVAKLFANVPVFDTGGRAATTTFLEREIGDVLITFESETQSIAKQYGTDKVDAVVPSMSLLAEFPVAIVDKVVDEHGTRELAKSYLEFLYTPEGQRIAAEHGNRVHDEAVAKAFAGELSDDPPGDRGGCLRRLGPRPEGAFRQRRHARTGHRRPLSEGGDAWPDGPSRLD